MGKDGSQPPEFIEENDYRSPITGNCLEENVVEVN
jgi:hypothetical protein